MSDPRAWTLMLNDLTPMRAPFQRPLRRTRAHTDEQATVARPLIMGCGSHTDTVVTTTRRSRTGVDLTCQHKNQTLLVEGPEIKIRPVGARQQRAANKSEISCGAVTPGRWSAKPKDSG
jgi:hypothetical protein